VRVLESGVDRGGNGVGVRQDFVVPEAKDFEAAAAQHPLTASIVSVVGVLRSVGFHDQLGGQADEINDVGEEDVLPSESMFGDAAVAEDGPKALLSFGRVLPHPLGANDQVRARDDGATLTLPRG
jgi:hypothetical protein